MLSALLTVSLILPTIAPGARLDDEAVLLVNSLRRSLLAHFFDQLVDYLDHSWVAARHCA